MFGVHNFFNRNILRKYIHGATYVIDFNDIEVNNKVTYQERSVWILDVGSKKLSNKEIALVKVLWNHHDIEEASWELESEMHEKFLDLFSMS